MHHEGSDAGRLTVAAPGVDERDLDAQNPGVDALVARLRRCGASPCRKRMLPMSTGRCGDSQQPGGTGTSEHDDDQFVQRLRSAPAEIKTELFPTLLGQHRPSWVGRTRLPFIDLCFKLWNTQAITCSRT